MIEDPKLRDAKTLWQIMLDRIEGPLFSSGLCMLALRLVEAGDLTWKEAEWLRREIAEDGFWARENRTGLTYWDAGSVGPRRAYLLIKIESGDFSENV